MHIPFWTPWREKARLASSHRQLETAVVDKQKAAVEESHPFLNDTLQAGHGHLPIDGIHGDPFGHGDMPKHMREASRVAVATNATAHGIIAAMTRLVFGKGYTFDAVSDKVQEVWDAFDEANLWSRRQKEWGRRAWRDGEAFVRKFAVKILEAWPPKIRFMEPELITDPQSKFPHGIQFDPNDAETPLKYVKVAMDNQGVRQDVIDADKVQHTKIGVDLATPRGVPLLNADLVDLSQLQQTRWAMGQKAKIAADYVLIQRYKGATLSQLADIRKQQQNDRPVVDFHGQEINTTTRHSGRIALANENVEYEWQGPGIGADEQHIVSRDTALSIGADVGLPEYIIRGDASNANRASQQVAETQAQATAEAWQDFFKDEFQLLWNWVMEQAIEVGMLTPSDDIGVTIQAPTQPRGDVLALAMAFETLQTDGVLSTQTFSALLNLDYEEEQAKIEEHAKRVGVTEPVEPAGDVPTEPEPAVRDEPREAVRRQKLEEARGDDD